MGEGRLELIEGNAWEEFVAAPLAVLVLAKSDCDACRNWSAELGEVLAAGRFPGVRFGKMLLDRPGLAGFKRANPWLAEVHDLPYTVIFCGGEKRKEFAGGGISRLEARLRSLGAEG